MLVTDYLVGRDGSDGRDGREPIHLVVNSVLPTDCQAGRSYIVQKLNRKDLIVEFVEDGGAVVDWINLPDLPQDVVDCLMRAVAIPLVDVSDNTTVLCSLSRDACGALEVLPE